LIEYFDADWKPLASGNCVEPGHLFEWAWLLRRFEAVSGVQTHDIYLPFYNLAEQHGICPRRGVAMNSLTLALEPLDTEARLWPQTERLKANTILAQHAASASERALYVERSHAAARAMARYFDDRREGQWYDKMRTDSSFVNEPAPASSLYHIACAIREYASLDQPRPATA
jgi:mannose/cellobiose epimerase-like protein (N-acyl-D-glucosamine 2-epimerase family)